MNKGTAATPTEVAPGNVVVEGLSFPTSITFDADANILVAEAGLPFGGARPGGCVWRIDAHGERTLVIDDLAPPVNGVTFHQGSCYVSEGGAGRITRVDEDGVASTVLQGLPGPGNYHTNMVAFGPDGKLYFSQGAMTNAGIIGLDAYELGWLRRLPHAHDVPGYDITLTGVVVRTDDPLSGRPGGSVETGAFVPFGTPTEPGRKVAAGLPCTAAVMRCEPDGSELELVAWGLRNAYGLGFLPDGRLLAVDQGADDRGSRPVGNAPDCLVEVKQGAWYGWPDFVAGEPVTDPRFQPSRGAPPQSLIANHAELPPPERALVRFPPHCAAVKFAVAPATASRFGGEIFVALFGDEAPMTAPAGPRVGREVVRIDPVGWTIHPVLRGDLLRPIDVAFHPHDPDVLYVVDFGQFEMDEQAVVAEAGTGKVWRYQLSA